MFVYFLGGSIDWHATFGEPSEIALLFVISVPQTQILRVRFVCAGQLVAIGLWNSE